MSLLQFSGLFVVWLLCTLFIATLTGLSFAVRFNFTVFFFSLLFCSPFFRLSADQRGFRYFAR